MEPACVTNFEIARRFEQIADILEIQGENPFKVRAYRTAAATILDLDDDLENIAARDGLKALPGFGEAIVAKTTDFLTTGTTALWERIKDSVPAGVVEMASLPGIGPKTAKALWDALDLTAVDALEQACRDQRVRTVSGFGAAKEAALLEKIAAWRRLSERIPRWRALPLAERVAAELRKIPGVDRIEIAGELRAGCDTVRKLCLLVQTPERVSVRNTIATLPVWDRVDTPDGYMVEGTEHSIGANVCVYLAPELNGYMRIGESAPQDFYHAIDLESVGIEATDERTATEESIFAALNWPFIPPEIRHWPGVIGLAEAGRLPKLVEEGDFRGQLHEHTTYSDGRNTIREMAEAALARGYEYLAITDHSRSLVIANGLSRDRLLAQLDEIAVLNAEFVPRGLRLLTGIEADILQDGSLDGDDDLLERLDIVVGSVHIRYKEDEAAMTKRIVTALSNPHLDLLGHPTGRLLGRREPYPLDIDAVIEAAARFGKVLEINAAPERMDLCDVHAKKAKAAGVKLSVNSDAHSVAGLDNLSWGLCMARRAGLEAADVINTYPWNGGSWR